MSWRDFGGTPAELPLTTIVRDPAIQVRAGGLDPDHVEDLARDQKKGDKLPSAQVVNVEGRGYLLVGGFHTVAASEKNGKAKIKCQVKKGTYAEALWIASGSNNDKAHKALKMNRADKARAVRMALEANRLMPAKEQHSDRKIAEHVDVSHTFVSDMRAKLEERQKARGTPEREEPTAKKERKPTPSMDSDDWRDMPWGEYLDVPDFVEAALRSTKAETSGEILSEIDKGVTFGLKPGPLRDLKDQVEAFRDRAEASAAGRQPPPGKFDWKACEQSIGVAVRGIEKAANHFQDHQSAEYKELDSMMGEILTRVRAWKLRLEKK